MGSYGILDKVEKKILGWVLFRQTTLPANHEADMPERHDLKPKFEGKTFAMVLVEVVDAN
jgi:hypothetical protein